MTLPSDERNAIIAYRIEKSKTTLAEAAGIAQQGFWNATTNRLYYAAYYMVSALLIKHGRIFTQLFELRQTGDYDDLYNLGEEQVSPFVVLIDNFIKEVETLIRG